MTPTLRHARRGLVVLLALASAGGLTATDAHAKDEERRAFRLEELERETNLSQEYQEAARKKRKDAINLLEGLINQQEEGERKAEMKLRLASLYYEEGRSLYLQEMERFQKEYDDCFNKAENADICDKMKPDHRESHDWYARTARHYQAIIKAYPQYSRADEATFYLGMTYADMGQVQEAQDAFKRLVKLYPDSKHVADAYILIGDHYFENNEAFPALRAYLKAASYKDSARYPYAMYKLAWSYYNVEEYGKAIETMKQVVTYSMENRGSGQNRAIRLEDEALKDLVRFFADAGEMDEAYAYFTKLGRQDLIRSALERLAGLYMEQGKFDLSVETYKRLIAEDPKHVKNPGYQEEIISAYRKMGKRDRVLDELKRLRDDYGKSSAWWVANASNPEAQREADDTIEKALRRTATDFNREARDLKQARHPSAAQAFENAVAAYYVYLDSYKDHPSSYNVHYDFGELLYMLKRYEEAYNEYMKVVSMNPQGEHSRFCAESAIFAAEEMVKQEGGGTISPKRKDFDKNVQPEPLSTWEQRMIDACALYAKLYPKDTKVETAIYKSAFLLYQRFHFTRAAELFRDVIAMNPKSENAEFSANLILDALRIKEEWVALRDTAEAFYKQEGLGKNAAFKKDMYGIWSAAAFTVIEKEFEKDQDHSKAADAFLAFYHQFPDFEKVDYALNNAAAYYYRANRVADSMQVRHILVEDPKFAGKTRFYYSQVANLGFDYERLADFDKAATYYDKLLALYPDQRKKVEKEAPATLADLDAQAADALYSSALFRTALGDWRGGIERYRRFVQLFSSDERVDGIRLVIGDILETREQWAEAESVFNAFWTKEGKDAAPELVYYARLHEGRAMLAQGRTADAHRAYKAAVDAYKAQIARGMEPGAHTEFVAEMMYELSKPVAERYLSIKITAPGSKNPRVEDEGLKKSLTAKTTALVELEKTYKAIIETGAGEWGLASLVGLGVAYENLGQSLIDSPCPAYLTADQCSFYKETIRDRAYPQFEKAVEAYRLALEKSYELNIYNENAAFATRRLGELRPAEFPALYEELPKPGRTSVSGRTFDVEKSLE